MQDVHALVVDDSKVGRVTMSRKLESMGIRVSQVESAREALDFIAQARPDMIFMDHMMPEMDGFEATRRIKSAPATQDIPVIIVSGNEEADFVRQAREIGAMDVFPKPPASEALEKLVAELAKAAPPVETPAINPVQVELDQLRAEVSARQETQTANLAQLERQMTDLVNVETRVQGVELRLHTMESENGKLLPEINALRANLEQMQSGDQLKPLEVKAQKLAGKVEGLTADIERVSGELHLLKAELEMRLGQIEEASLEQQNLRIAFADLSERTSDARLTQFVTETVENLKAAKSNGAAGEAGGELAQMQGKLKRLVMLGVLGWFVLLGGLVLLLLR